MCQFLLFMAERGKANFKGETLSRVTMVGYANNLFGTIEYCNRRFSDDVRLSIIWWVKYNLTQELGLNKNRVLPKPIAYHKDVTIILSALSSPLSLRGFKSMRMVLNAALFINLTVDSCGRAHKIIASAVFPTHYLRWRDVKVWAFKKDSGNVRFAALVRFTELKGHKDNPQKWKEMPLKLLPTTLCFEDSLRLILHIALMDGHLSGISTWTELESYAKGCAANLGKLHSFKDTSQNILTSYDQNQLCGVTDKEG